jgi:multidrug efflux pump subunit AcrA (membrane-fusion protein)
VTLGPIVDGLRVVRSGLGRGDLVVVNGLQRVRPGMAVDVNPVRMERAGDVPASGPRS